MPPFERDNFAPELRAQLDTCSEQFIHKRYEDTKKAASDYISSLHNLLQCIDMTAPLGPSKAHGIINMIEQVQKMQAALVKPEPSREERVEGFSKRR